MKQEVYYLPIETPDGMTELEINHVVVHHEDDITVTISAVVQNQVHSYQSDTTENALICLAKNLPETWRIKSCFSCRHGHFCPIGDMDNELFCVTDFEPKSPRDLWYVTEAEEERKKRSRTLFDCCEQHKEQIPDYFTYSDYYYRMNRTK